MALSNTAVPKYYGMFRDAVIRGEIPVNEQISLEMNRIDKLIDDPKIYYDEAVVEGWIFFCENEMTLTDGGDVHVLFSLSSGPSNFLAGTTLSRKVSMNRVKITLVDTMLPSESRSV